jgi:o-succinylbenzoate synthase
VLSRGRERGVSVSTLARETSRAASAAAQPALRLERLELREIQMPLVAPFETSFGSFSLRRILIVRVFDSSGAFGYGECTAAAEPFYNAETVDTAWYVTTAFIGPLLARSSTARATDVDAALAPIREHRMAKAAVETAIWDLEAKLAGEPLWRHLGGTRPVIDCGVSIGLQRSVDELLEKVSRELDRGYQRIKIKIKPGHDVELVEAIRARHPAIALSVDANSAYSLDRDLDLLRELDGHGLMMIEQPLAAGDLVDHAKLQRELRTPLCLDESVVNLATAQHALELGACRILNIKLGRVGGHTDARAIQDLARANGLPAWCGGMLESGVGRAHNIAMATLPGFTLPGDISASARYFAEDVIDPPVTVSKEGTISAPAAPGIGYAVDEARLDALTVRREEIEL